MPRKKLGSLSRSSSSSRYVSSPSKSSSKSKSTKSAKSTKSTKSPPKKKSPQRNKNIYIRADLTDVDYFHRLSRRVCDSRPRRVTRRGYERVVYPPRQAGCLACEKYTSDLHDMLVTNYNPSTGYVNLTNYEEKRLKDFIRRTDYTKNEEGCKSRGDCIAVEKRKIRDRELEALEKTGIGISEWENPALKVLPRPFIQSLAKAHGVAANSTKKYLDGELSKSKYMPLKFNEMLENLKLKDIKAQAKKLKIKQNQTRAELTKQIKADLKRKERSHGARLVGGPYELIKSYL